MVIAILTVDWVGCGHHHKPCPWRQFPNIVSTWEKFSCRATFGSGGAGRRRPWSNPVATPIEQQSMAWTTMNYMYSLNATGNFKTTLVADFDLKTDPNTDLILTPVATEQLAAGQLPPDVSHLRRHQSEVRDRSAHAGRAIFPKGQLRYQVPWQLRVHHLNDPIARCVRCGPDSRFRGRGAVMRMRLWVQPDKLAKARHHGHGHRQCSAAAEHGQSRLARWVVNSSREPAIHFYSVLAQGRLSSPEPISKT